MIKVDVQKIGMEQLRKDLNGTDKARKSAAFKAFSYRELKEQLRDDTLVSDLAKAYTTSPSLPGHVRGRILDIIVHAAIVRGNLPKPLMDLSGDGYPYLGALSAFRHLDERSKARWAETVFLEHPDRCRLERMMCGRDPIRGNVVDFGVHPKSWIPSDAFILALGKIINNHESTEEQKKAAQGCLEALLKAPQTYVAALEALSIARYGEAK